MAKLIWYSIYLRVKHLKESISTFRDIHDGDNVTFNHATYRIIAHNSLAVRISEVQTNQIIELYIKDIKKKYDLHTIYNSLFADYKAWMKSWYPIVLESLIK